MRENTVNLIIIAAALMAMNMLFASSVDCFYTDQEVIGGNSFQAYKPKMWRQTTEDDFNGGSTSGTVVLSSGAVALGGSGDAVSTPSIFAIVGGESDHMYRYSIEGNSWTRAPDAPGPIGPGGKMVSDGDRYLYVLQGNGSKDFWQFDAHTGIWSSMEDAPGPVNPGSDLYHYGGAIYALQGETSAVWKYDIPGNSWTSVIKESQYSMGPGSSIVVWDSMIYVLRPDSPNFISVSTNGGSWSSAITALPAGTAIGPGADSMIILNGGRNQITIVVLFGDEKDSFYHIMMNNKKWREESIAPFPIGAGGGMTHQGDQVIGTIYTLAGNSSNGFASTPYKDRKPTGQWTVLSPIPEAVNDGGGLAFANWASQYYDQGEFISSTHDTEKIDEVMEYVYWNLSITPSMHQVALYVRTSDSQTSISSGDWIQLSGVEIDPGSTSEVSTFYADLTGITGRYVQYMVKMSSDNSETSPVLHEVRLYYRGV